MSWFDFDWVDAFSDRAFGGNGCAVVHGGAFLSEDVCMAYVRETSLVECTFTGPSEVADFRVRYFPGQPRDSLCRAPNDCNRCRTAVARVV